MPYKYYHRLFYDEFSTRIGFEPPQTDCCNTCANFLAEIKRARNANNFQLADEKKIQHKAHLELAAARRKEMNIDYKGKDVEDILITHSVIEYDEHGQVIDDDIIDHIL